MADTVLMYSLNIFYKAAVMMLELLPYLFVGVILGEALRYYDLYKWIRNFRKRDTFTSILAAAILGMLSPLCTFGTVPVAISLYTAGAHISVPVVFLIASSMMNPQLFIITWGGIGLEMAVMRILTILVFTLAIGCILMVFPEKWIVRKREFVNRSENHKMPGCTKTNFTWRHYAVSALKSFEYIGFYIVTGVVLTAAIEVLVPASFTGSLFQQDKTLQIFAAAILSIPFYTCGGGVIPVVKSFMAGGMSSGTALAFLNVGSATRITVIMALAAIVRPLFIVIYILTLIVFSVLTGYLYN